MVAVLLSLVMLRCTLSDETAKQDSVPQQPKISKAQLKTQYDAALSKGDTKTALAAISKLIGLDDSQLNYFARSEIHIKRKEYEPAISDLQRAIEKDPKMLKAYLTLGRLQTLTGACAASVEAYKTVLKLKPAHKDAPPKLKEAEECNQHSELASRLFAAGQYSAAKDALEKALAIATESSNLLLKKAEVALATGDTDSILLDTLKVLKRDQQNLQALLLKGQAHYIFAEHDMALKYWREGLRLAPEHVELKKHYKNLKLLLKHVETGEEGIKQGNFKEAAEAFGTAYDMDACTREYHVNLRLRQSEALTQGKNVEGALKIIDQILKRDPDNMKARLKRGEANLAAERYQEAVDDFQKAVNQDHQNREAHDGLRKAELELKKSKRKNYYKILGVAQDADAKAIKKEFRKLALLWHPDKHTGEEEQKKAELEFREIAEAYEILSDPEARGKYDRGEDIQPQQQHQHQGFNPFAGGNFHFQWG